MKTELQFDSKGMTMLFGERLKVRSQPALL